MTLPADTATVASLGEHGLLKAIREYVLCKSADVPVGFGDDCAVIRGLGLDQEQILTTDLLIEGTHFLRNKDTEWKMLGHKAMAANLSDIASMGGEPLYALISLGLPGEFPVRDLIRIYEGMHNLAMHNGCHLIGGDTARSPQLIINIALVGARPRTHATMLRSSCKPGHYVYLTGALGGSRAGLQLLTESRFSPLRDSVHGKLAITRHLCPEPRLAVGQLLGSLGGAIGCIDISDGLYNELGLLAESSMVGFHIRIPDIPVPEEVQIFCNATEQNPDEFCLFSGEEYELLFTTSLAPAELHPFLEERQVSTPVTEIGRVVADPEVRFFGANGDELRITRDNTYKHF